jgi:type I restriction enzyme, R subunit
MAKQPEAILEEQLIVQLQDLGYTFVHTNNEAALIENLKNQLEKHNKCTFSKTEFERVLNILNKGSVFEKSKTLREKQHIARDNGDNLYFEFINTDFWCQNQFQVTNQVSQEGKYKNRYDVTILINGLPLVQIELKRRGLELKEAFNQTNRYQRHSYGSGNALFQYIQIFIISNGVNTKYYSNNRNQSFKQTFYWTDVENKRLTNILNGFTDAFLEPCHISKMICKYIVLNEAYKIPMVLRPYQYYAVEALIDRVKSQGLATQPKNGYIWHTTGSGKTLTSFKASQILMNLPQVHKVVFVVDRKDLDFQTTKEFNSFSKGSIDGTDNTKALVKQFTDDTKLIVTTIQKLNTAISKLKYEKAMAYLKDKRIVFIFDECHRSQFGDTHKRIKEFFGNSQMFGFTGTPIFADNANKNELGKRTTKDLFEDCLHKYVITDAIKDENVLKFSVEYVGRYKWRDERPFVSTESNIDIEVEDIDTQELMEDSTRLDKITDYIITHHSRKTHSRAFTGMFCVDSVKTLIKYYDLFKQKKQEGKHNLNVATIFSYAANEDDADANGFIPEEVSVVEEPQALYGLHTHSREKLDEFIEDYNQLFDTKFSTKDSESFYNYYNDISKKVKERKVDILLVVNMFLTGFDSPSLNTLYVDKNLKYHGLIQAYSRTNRILNELKSQGNIVAFRNLKNRTDEAITLFSNKDAIEVIIMKPYENYTIQFDEAFGKLLEITPTVESVNDLVTEDDELAFVKAFRELMRVKNILSSFSDFKWEDLQMTETLFEDYKSKYLDLHDKVKSDNSKEKVSILDDVDFELELIHRDDINVAYIIQLLIKLKLVQTNGRSSQQAEQEIINLLSTETTLRSKRELIEKFIKENLPEITDTADIQQEFDTFWSAEQKKAFADIVVEENLSATKTEKLIEDYLFAEREPLRDEIINLLEGEKPGVLTYRKTADRILKRILDFVEMFINGMVG